MAQENRIVSNKVNSLNRQQIRCAKKAPITIRDIKNLCVVSNNYRKEASQKEQLHKEKLVTV